MSKGWNIAILGATGAVGEALLEILFERQFPVRKVFALVRTENTGKNLHFLNEVVQVQDATSFDWKKAQLAFFAAGEEATKTYIDKAINVGCLVIDLSGLFALEEGVPLVIPEVNSFMLIDCRNHNLIAVPSSLTSQLLTAVKPLIEHSGLFRINVTSLLSISIHGKKAVDMLALQSAKVLNGIPIDKDDCFGRQLAFNILPMIMNFKGNVDEESRVVNESRKILQDKNLKISARCVQAPVFYGHAQIINFEGLRPLTAEEGRAAFISAKDIVLSEESDFPTQVDDATGNAQLSVSCVRNDYGIPGVLQFWSVADNIRFGGALMAAKIAEKLVQEYLC